MKLLLSLLALGCGLATATDPIVVYYYTQWAMYGRGYCADEFLEPNHFKGTTHIQYAFLFPNANCTLGSLDYEADLGPSDWVPHCEQKCHGLSFASSPSIDRGNVGCLRRVRTQLDGVQLGISLGGWTKSMDFSKCVATSANRELFANNIVENVNAWGWDFIDFDWEYPQGGGNDGWIGTGEDWANLKLLIQLLRTKTSVGIAGAFGMNPNLIEGTDQYENPTPMAWLCENLDYVSTMSYDLAGGWSAGTGWPAPLYHDPAAPYLMADKLTIQWQLETWKAACGPNFHKVVLGLPAYGKSWRNVPAGPHGNGVYESCSWTGAGPKDYPDMPCLADGSFCDSPGTLEVWDIHLNYLSQPSCTHYFHDIAKQDFVYCTSPMYLDVSPPCENIWFAYDGPEAFYDKVKMAKEMGAGGYMFWESAYTMIAHLSTVPTPEQWATMDPLHSQATIANLASNSERYFWADYEDACLDAWNGVPKSASSTSKGIRFPSGGAPPTDAPTSPPPGSDTLNCDEVTTSNVVGGTVSSSCASAFCSHACNTFVSGACQGHSDLASCVQGMFHDIPPAGASGISCQFGTG